VTRDIGGELKCARERQGLSLEDVSHRSKITVPTLRAIERNDWRLVPGGLYLRAFLRTYAREVGCDPEEIVAGYRDMYDDRSAEAAAEESIAGLKTIYPPTPLHSVEIDAMDRRRNWLHALGGVAVVLVGGALYVTLGWNSGRAVASIDRRQADQSNTAPATAGATLIEPAPVGDEHPIATSGSATPPPPATAGTNGLQLEIEARGLCWLSGTADGQQVIYRLLNAGERATISAHADVVLRVGDEANFSYTINGKTGRTPGAPGEPVTLHLTPANYATFLGTSIPPAPAPPPLPEPIRDDNKPPT